MEKDTEKDRKDAQTQTAGKIMTGSRTMLRVGWGSKAVCTSALTRRTFLGEYTTYIQSQGNVINKGKAQRGKRIMFTLSLHVESSPS